MSIPRTYLEVNSNVRVNPSTTFPSDCTIHTQLTLSGRYALKSILLPVTYHNVNANNNTIYFTDTGGARTCQLPIGYYSQLSDLAAAVATAMTAAGAGVVTCSVSSRTNVLTVINTVAFSFTFGSNKLNSAGKLMGIVSDTATALSQSGTQTMNLNSTSCYNFIIDDASSEVVGMDGSRCTFKIPATTATPNEVYYEPSEQFPIRFTLTSTKVLRIRIMDDQFRILNNMRSDFYMMLQKDV